MSNLREFKLCRISLTNIFNYRDDIIHRIDFTTDRTGNIFLFDIKNGGGKTSLFLSIKWGFYGFAPNVTYIKDKKVLHAKDFINKDRKSKKSFSVSIEFDYDGHHMKLRRTCPDYNKDYTDLALVVDGNREDSFNGDSAQDYIFNLLPPDYGDFFMFDGETLQDIASRRGDIKRTDQVMKMLGLTQLKELRKQLNTIQTALSAEFTKVTETTSSLKPKMDSISRLRKEKAAAIDEENRLGRELAEIERTIQEFEQERDTYSNIESTYQELLEKNVELKSAEANSDRLVKYIKEHSKYAFILFMEPDVRKLICKFENQIAEIKKARHSDGTIDAEFYEIQKMILEKHITDCPICNSHLDESHIMGLQAKLDGIKEQSDAVLKEKAQISNLRKRINFMEDQLSLTPDGLSSKFNELFDTSETIIGIKHRIDELNKFAANSDIEEVRSISNQLSGLYRAKSKKKADIADNYNKQKSLEGDIQRMNDEIARQGGLTKKQESLSHQLTRIDRLLKGLDVTIKQVSDNKRSDILSVANDVFLGITNKSDIYRGLEYDAKDSFSMHIVGRDGSEVPLPSSGDNHVLAISFLISLSVNTERLTPMVMDTPLSRLDDVHKLNIGKTLAKLENQVIFLAQPGELDDKTRSALMPSVAKMFMAEPTFDNTARIREVPL